jgi:pimeloyl-ACP methyl ester carboxylesterase
VGLVSELIERSVATPAGMARVWEKGAGTAVGFFAGLGGLPAWLPALDALAARHRVVAPSLPGFPGGADYERLDDIFDWSLAAIDLVQAAGLAGADLIGASVGGALAAEVAALRPDLVRKLILIAPFGLFDEAAPIADVFAFKSGAQSGALTRDPQAYDAYRARPNSADETDWTMMQIRGEMAAARLLWPLGDTRLRKRLFRITQPTLIIWGAEDRVIPPAYAAKFADGISGKTTIVTIPKAGHKVEFDAPDAVATAIAEFLEG